MLERECVAKVRPLPAEAFYRTGHQAVYRAILALDDRGEIADLVSLAGELRSRGDLEAVGGVVALSGLLDFATTTANLEHHVRLIRLAYAQRQALKTTAALSQEIGTSNGVTFSDLLAGYGTRIEQIRREAEPGARPPTFVEQVRSSAELLDNGSPAPRDLIGSGYIVAGGLTLLASAPGFGKTYLLLQAMRALASGTPWLEYEAAQCRTLMLQLEMPAYAIRERIGRSREMFGEAADWLVMPEGFEALERGDTLDQLSLLIERRKIELVGMDPLHQLHGGNLNFDEELTPFLNAIRKLRMRTGVHVWLLHHLNKSEFDKHDSLRSNVLRSIKGSGRLTGDPDTVLGLIERHGRLHLVNAKTRLGPSVESIAIRQDPDSGWFERTSTPEEQSMGTDNKLETCLRYHGRAGATLEQLTTETDMSRGTVQRHLSTMDVAKVGGGKGGRGLAARYFLAEFCPQEEVDLDENCRAGKDSQMIDDGQEPGESPF
jgi:replicative DNA helicase